MYTTHKPRLECVISQNEYWTELAIERLVHTNSQMYRWASTQTHKYMYRKTSNKRYTGFETPSIY